MADYTTIKYSGQVTPVEDIEAKTGGDRYRIVESSIDKIFTGSGEYQLGALSDNLMDHKEYTTTNSRVSLEHSTIFNNSGLSICYLAVFIKEQVGATGANCYIYFENTVAIAFLSGIGDFTIIPMRAMDYDGDKIQLASSSSNHLAKIDILIGEI